MIAGLTTYGYLAVSARSVGAARYAPLSALWAMVLIGGPGLFFPLEQEVARAVAARRARGEGVGPVVRRAAVLGALVATAVVVLMGAFRGQLGGLLDDQPLLGLGLVLAVPGYAGQHLARGFLSGSSRFRTYGLVLAVEGTVRLTASLGLALGGVRSAGPYGVALGLAPLLALVVVRELPAGMRERGPQAPWPELSQALGHLLAASLLSQVLVNVGPVVVKALAPISQREAAGSFLAGLVLARVPLFLFAAVQAALLPSLARLAAAGRLREFSASVVRLLVVVTVVCTAATAAAATVGPATVRVLFGPGFALGGGDLAALAAASGAYIVALCSSQALIALAGHRQTTIGWLAGLVAFAAATSLPGEVVGKVERGLLAGAVSAALVHGVILVRRVRAQPGGRSRGGSREEGSPSTLSPAPLEP